MNIAFSALVILFLALPGICSIIAYRSERGRPVGVVSITDEIPSGAAISLLLHFVWVLLFNFIGSTLCDPKKVALGKVLTLLAAPSAKDGGLASGLEDCVCEGYHPVYIFLYELSICAFAFLAGGKVKELVTDSGIDRRSKFFRWNDWFYLLRGESPEQKAREGYYDSIAISAVIDDYLYVGYLYDFFLNRQGELDTIVLELPQRRKLGSKEDPAVVVVGPVEPIETDEVPPFYPIEVDYLVLMYSEVRNLGIIGVGVADDEVEVLDDLKDADIDLQ